MTAQASRAIGPRLFGGGAVRAVTLEPTDDEVTILASIAIGTQTVEVRGTGQTLLAAYADLCCVAAAGLLATLFTDLVGA